MEQFEGFEKLKKMKNGNGIEWEKWVAQTKGKYNGYFLIYFMFKTFFSLFYI